MQFRNKTFLEKVYLVFGLAAALVAPAKGQAPIPDFTPPTPLIRALIHNDTAEAKRLLQQGADPNHPKFLLFPPLFLPVMYGNEDLVREMIAHGADLSARDDSGATALMWAAYNESGDATLVKELLRMGADPAATNFAGETAADWALRRGYTPAAEALQAGGDATEARRRDAVQRAIELLQKSSPQFLRVSGCVSCHHQSLPQMAADLARGRGIAVDEDSAKLQTAATIAMYEPFREEMERSPERVPDPAISISYALLGLAADHYPSDQTTRAMARLVAKWQAADGRFEVMPVRPPLESSQFAATALSIRALQFYGEDPAEPVARARQWLRTAVPADNQDRAMQLLGLAWAGETPEQLAGRVQALLAEQHSDGGWSQLPNLEADAYATGQALVALKVAGDSQAAERAYQRGVAFLTRTQLSDGSWLVRTRAFPIQPYKESGFPHGRDQWISASGTSWAAMAISMGLPEGHRQPSWVAPLTHRLPAPVLPAAGVTFLAAEPTSFAGAATPR